MLVVHFEIARLSQCIHQIHIKALHLIAGIKRFKRGKFGIHCHPVNFIAVIGRSGRASVAALAATRAQHQSRAGKSRRQPFFHIHGVFLIKQWLSGLQF
jgi:hypothetical protein